MKDNQHEQLFQELGNETAAAIQGGAALEVFNHYTFGILGGKLGEFNKSSGPQLSAAADNKISGIKINSGTWEFHKSSGFNDRNPLVLKEGKHKTGNYGFNDNISSFRKIAD